MKKVLALIVAMLPLIAFAQKFELTQNGWVNADDKTKSFIVVESQGTKAELFAKAKTAVTSMWNSPKDVLSYNEPDIIIVNGYNNGSVKSKSLGMTFVYAFNYRLQLQFKDGKIRIDAPSVDKGELDGGKSTLYFGCGKASSWTATKYIFDQNGKLKEQKHKEQVENAMNELVYCLIKKINEGVANEDW